MKATYREALKAVLVHEGGYSNHPSDKGGPTNWGITIADARMYWKPKATAIDVQRMPVDVAYDIYRKRYADVLRYDELPAGVDYAVLDFGINSGVSRSAKFLQRILKVKPIDGKIGLVTLTAAAEADQSTLINSFYNARVKFLRGLDDYPVFGDGWERRCKEGRILALKFANKYPHKPEIKAPRPNLKPGDVAPIDPKVIEGSDTATDGGAKAIPDEPKLKPATESKTIWGGILGYLATIGTVLGSIFEHLNNKYALAAFGGATIIGGVALVLVIKGRIDIGKIAAHFKEKADE